MRQESLRIDPQNFLTLAKARSLDAAKEEQLRPWAWKQADGSYKIAAGFLLEYTEFQKGYVLNGKVLRPAKVKVNVRA